MGYIYKIINNINSRWYIGKHNGSDPNYMGSGKLLKLAIKKYGIENFTKIILEECNTDQLLNDREIWWIDHTNACNDLKSYNLVPGGTGGDRSKYIPYDKIDYSNHKMTGTKNWYASLTAEEKSKFYEKQSNNRCKGWYVSKVDDPTEVYVHNISKWCEEHNIDKSIPTSLNTPGSTLFQKQVKGWRIRKEGMPPLPPYVNLSKIGHPNVACKGKSWKLIDGKRVWFDK